MVSENKVELNKGLRNGYYDRTESSLIVPKPGKLLYRGYNIDDLARHSTFEETTYLLLYGSLPSRPPMRRAHREACVPARSAQPGAGDDSGL